MQEEICTSRHLVLAKIGDDKLLSIQFVSTLNARGSDRMTFRCITSDDEYEVCLPHIGDRAGVAAISNGTEEPNSCRRLAVSGTIVNIVCSDHSSGQLLHQVAFFVCTLRRRDKPDGVRPIVCFQL